MRSGLSHTRTPRPHSLAAARAVQAWRELTEAARQQGAQIGRAEPIEKFAAAHLVRLVSQTSRVPFPLAHVSAQAAAKAFLGVAQAYVTCGREQDRTALAAFMSEGARCLDKILTEHAHAAAEVWRRTMPGED